MVEAGLAGYFSTSGWAVISTEGMLILFGKMVGFRKAKPKALPQLMRALGERRFV